MSRYTFKTEIHGKEYEVAYGFDPPIGEYFIQVFDYSIEDEDSQCVVWKGSRMDNLSNSQILRLYKIWNVPKEHQNQVALDLTF